MNVKIEFITNKKEKENKRGAIKIERKQKWYLKNRKREWEEWEEWEEK